MSEQRINERFGRDDAFWKGPRLHVLLIVSLAIAIALIYFIASVRSGDYTWSPFAHDPARELPPSGW